MDRAGQGRLRREAREEEDRIESMLQEARVACDLGVAECEEELAAWQVQVFQVMEVMGVGQAEAARALNQSGGSVEQAASRVMQWADGGRSRADGKRPKPSP